MKTIKNVFLILSVITMSASYGADARQVMAKATKLLSTLKNDLPGYSQRKIDRVDRKLNDLRAVMTGKGKPNRPTIQGDGEIRLSNGYLEVFFNNEWKGVCDDSFDANDGKVVCSQLGGTYESHRTSVSGNSDMFWLDDLNCVGDEQYLSQCRHNGVGSEDCGSTEHVQVSCSGLPLDPQLKKTIRNTTVLEVLHDGQWKPVCDDSFDQKDAEVACRQMGKTLVRFSTGVSAPGDSFWLDDLSCSGSETSLFQCGHNGLGSEDCGSSEHVQLICQ